MYDPAPKFRPKVQPRVQPKVTVPSYIKESGQVGDWLFYNGAGDVLYDFSGGGNHGDINGAKWTDEHSASWALEFDGENDYVDLGDPDVLEPTDEITVSFWFKSTTTATAGQSAVRHDGHFTPLQLTSGGDGRAVVFIGGTTYTAPFDWSNWNDGGWHFYVAIFDSTAGTKIYIDDMTTPVATDSTTGTLDTTSKPWQLGRAEYNSEYWKGVLGSVRFYDRAISESERVDIYEHTKPLYTG